MEGEVRGEGAGVQHGRPLGQVTRAAELTAVLSRPYRVVGGQVSLAGCLLEDVPFLEGRDASGERVWFDHWGRRVTGAFAESLGLDRTELMERAPVSWGGQELAAWKQRIAEQIGTAGFEVPAPRVIWCKWARGKLSFRVGEVGTELPFEGWAQAFLDGSRRPRSWECPATGKSGDELLLTDDGELTVSQAAHRCVRTGRLRIETRLELTAGHQWVSSEYLETCPLTRARCEPEAMVECSRCGGRVAPAGLRGGLCPLCREAVRLGSKSVWADWLSERLGSTSVAQWRSAEGGGRVVLTRSGWLSGETWLLDADSRQVLQHRVRRGWGRWRESDAA